MSESAWEQFIEEIYPDREVRDYFKAMLGSALSSVSARSIPCPSCGGEVGTFPGNTNASSAVPRGKSILSGEQQLAVCHHCHHAFTWSLPELFASKLFPWAEEPK